MQFNQTAPFPRKWESPIMHTDAKLEDDGSCIGGEGVCLEDDEWE